MNERDGLFLNHVISAIADIESFTADGRSAFMADRKTQSAVAYFSVDLDAVWSMIEQDLPPLRAKVQQLLETASKSRG